MAAIWRSVRWPSPGVWKSAKAGVSGPPLRSMSASNYTPQGIQTCKTNNGTNVTTDAYCRVAYVIGANTTDVTLGFPNWYLAPGAGVTNGPNSFTVTQLALEANNTYQQMYFGGSATTTVAPGANVLSDSINASAFGLSQFLQGTVIYVRVRLTFSAPMTDKMVWSGNQNQSGVAFAPLVDPTKVNFTTGIMATGNFAYSMINGGVNGTDAIAGNFYRPVMLGHHSGPATGFWGDSKTYGTQDNTSPTGIVGLSRCLMTAKDTYTGAKSGINFGNPSGVALDCTTAVGAASVSSLTYWYQYINYAVVGYGTNGTNQAAQTALHTQIRTAGISKIIQRSLTPRDANTVGKYISLTGATASGTLVTGTATSTANLVNGNTYTILGATGTGAALNYNGSYVVSVLNGTTIQYTASAAPTATATGTIFVEDCFRTTAGQTAATGWSTGGTADIFETWLRGLVTSDANMTYYQSYGERAGTTGTAYWQWKCDGVTPYLDTADGLHESSQGYEDNIAVTGSLITQAGTTSGTLRGLVQAFT